MVAEPVLSERDFEIGEKASQFLNGALARSWKQKSRIARSSSE